MQSSRKFFQIRGIGRAYAELESAGEKEMFYDCIERVRKKAPMIHSITNYVTANDVANVLLACGCKPIMSDEPEDAAEITALQRPQHQSGYFK